VDGALTQAELEDFKTEALINRYFKKFLDDKVTDQAVEDYYNEHSTDYEEQRIRIAHVLFRISTPVTDAERKAQLAAARNAYTQLKAGKDFAELASALSDDKVSGKIGGDLGSLRVGSTYPMLVKRAVEMKAGEFSEPLESPQGYHLVKVLEPVQTITKPLRTVQSEIRNRLRTEARIAETERLLAKAQVEIDGKPRQAKEQSSTTSAATDKPVAAR
jgi:peptidyl-prolyl cis-trans isomerase C